MKENGFVPKAIIVLFSVKRTWSIKRSGQEVGKKKKKRLREKIPTRPSLKYTILSKTSLKACYMIYRSNTIGKKVS